MMNHSMLGNPAAEKKAFEPHEVETAAQHLMHAEAVKQNPELHQAAIMHLSKQKKAITSIQGLRDRANALDKAPTSPDDESPAEEAAEMGGQPLPKKKK